MCALAFIVAGNDRKVAVYLPRACQGRGGVTDKSEKCDVLYISWPCSNFIIMIFVYIFWVNKIYTAYADS